MGGLSRLLKLVVRKVLAAGFKAGSVMYLTTVPSWQCRPNTQTIREKLAPACMRMSSFKSGSTGRNRRARVSFLHITGS